MTSRNGCRAARALRCAQRRTSSAHSYTRQVLHTVGARSPSSRGPNAQDRVIPTLLAAGQVARRATHATDWQTIAGGSTGHRESRFGGDLPIGADLNLSPRIRGCHHRSRRSSNGASEACSRARESLLESVSVASICCVEHSKNWSQQHNNGSSSPHSTGRNQRGRCQQCWNQQWRCQRCRNQRGRCRVGSNSMCPPGGRWRRIGSRR